jgi:hypothetical protein
MDVAYLGYRKQGEEVQRPTFDDLGKAIDRLIERCRSLDRDRTALAHALARVKDELIHERTARAESDKRCQELRACQEEAALRLETLADLIAKTGGFRADTGKARLEERKASVHSNAGSFVCTQTAGLCSESGRPQADAAPDTGENPQEKMRDPLAHVVTKTWDLMKLERIVRPSADEPEKTHPEMPDAAHAPNAAASEKGAQTNEQDSIIAAESDRLF